MKQIKIKIPYETNIYIQRLFYEVNAYQEILAYLVNECKSKEYFEDYLKDSVKRKMELELAKTNVFNEYMPFDKNIIKYWFDFDEDSIIYEVAE